MWTKWILRNYKHKFLSFSNFLTKWEKLDYELLLQASAEALMLWSLFIEKYQDHLFDL